MSHAQERLAKLGTIKAIVRKSETGAIKERLIAQCCVQWGSSRRTVLEYLKMLIQDDVLKEEHGVLFIK